MNHGEYLNDACRELINRIYDEIILSKNADCIEIFLGEVTVLYTNLCCEALKKLKEDKILYDYNVETRNMDDIFIENPVKLPTEDDLRYDPEEYVELIIDKNNRELYPPSLYDPGVFVIIKKSDINKTKLNRLITHKPAVEIIEMVEEQGSNNIIFVNKNFEFPYKIRKSSSANQYWQKIYQIAKDRECNYDSNLIKYFNANPHNPIYYALGYRKTKILKKVGDKVLAEIQIKITEISEVKRSLGQKKRRQAKPLG